MSIVDYSVEHPSTELQGFYAWTDTLRGIQYGPGSVSTALPKFFGLLGVSKALVLTGRSLYEKSDVVKKVEGILKAINGYGATYYKIGQHSPIAGIRDASKVFIDSGCDVIVSVGGGSPVDAAKAILYYLQQERGGETMPQIAIPTTLSAAEYSIGAGYTDESGKKVAVSSQKLAPAAIILDAELTLATPERLWLSTGIRALDHCVENLYRPLVPPPLKAMGLSALADLFKYLPESKANPKSVEIRQKLQIASWMSLWPIKFGKYSALGLSHSLGHKLGAAYSIPHGITSCLTLAPVVELMSEIGTEQDKEYLAKAFFYLHKPSTGTVDGDVKALSACIKQLVADLGLSSTLSDYNVPREDIPVIAANTLGTETHQLFPETVKLLENLY
ncbi:alcohol dehydrogenase IV [Lentinula aff. detonsa]|uniref:Alcohol dehydrogenase IV n=1 Tax=Lentinula aff. detonsa TaxID=2804958 RepID=A0AA38U0U2_9AGAR|nr:alcohol dehydrogenase IV [Lentinula aff. detonsa]KAJ3802968.1 alcohol dehydrogenase IV [Lentinula aff. detonsa]